MSSSAPAPTTVLEVFDALDAPGTPLTTPEVAEEFDCVNRTIYNKLETLADDGAIETKKVGSRGRVWWRPPTEHGNRHDSALSRGREETNAERRAAEEQLRLATEAAELGVFEWDPATDEVKWENDRMFEIVGRDKADSPVNAATFVDDVVHADDAGQFEAAIEEALQSGRFHFVGRFRPKDGELRWIEFTGQVEWGSDGEPVRMPGVAADVTERKRQERLQEEQTRLLERIASGAPLEECLTPLCTTVSTLDPSVRASIVLSDDENQSFERCIAPDLSPAWREELVGLPIDERQMGTCGEAVFGGTPVTCEDVETNDRWSEDWTELCLANDVLAGHSMPIHDEDGEPIGSFMLCFDEPGTPDEWEQLSEFGTHVASIALERERKTRSLRESEERYRTLFESIDEGFCVVEVLFDEDGHPEDYRFRETNSAFEEQTGLVDAEGERMRELEPNHEDHWFETYGRIAQTGAPERFTNEAEHLGDRWYDVYGFRIGQPEERTVAILFNDITERKERERRLERQREQIEKLKDRLLETSPTGILVVDETGEITLANDRATEILGMSRKELVGLAHDTPELGVVDSNGDPIPDGQLPFEQVSAAGEAVFGIELGATRADGERIWLSVNVAPLYSDATEPTETVVSFEDITEHKQANEALAHLNDTSRELMEADKTEIIDRAADITQEVVNVEYASLWRYDDETGDLELQTASTAPEIEPGEIRHSEKFDERAWQVFVSKEVDMDNDLPPATDIAASEKPLRSGIIVPLGRHGIICVGSIRPDEFDDRTTDIAETVAANVETALDRADDEQQLEAQNTELTQLNRLNTIIREIDRVLVESDTREEIEQVVCERLSDSDLYEFAWVGATEPGAERVKPREWDGIDPGPLDRMTTDDGLVGTALQTRETQIIEDIVTDARSASWREQALERGVRSCISVPLHYEESLYGVLTVYANRPQSNSRECEVLEELGETIAHAINAVETKQALGGESVIEVGVELRDPDVPLSRLADWASCDIEFEGLVPQSGDASSVFFTAHETSFDEIHAAADESTAIKEVICLTNHENGCLCKALVTGPTLASVIFAQNATIRSLSISDGTVTANVDLSQTVDVRKFVESLQTEFSDIELISRQTRESPMQTREGFRAAFEDHLTDRQQEVLRTAYLSGFFKSPRETTGQQLAELFDVSQSTFAQHLRAGQDNHFGLLFDEV